MEQICSFLALFAPSSLPSFHEENTDSVSEGKINTTVCGTTDLL